MAVLTAEFPPTTGDAVLDSYSVTFQPEKTRQRIGYCPQFDAHFTNMTGREHIELYAAIKGLPKSAIKGAVASKLAEVGLSEYDGNRLSSQYSGGMKRKLSVAIATIGSPPIVFLDEPSTGMVRRYHALLYFYGRFRTMFLYYLVPYSHTCLRSFT